MNSEPSKETPVLIARIMVVEDHVEGLASVIDRAHSQLDHLVLHEPTDNMLASDAVRSPSSDTVARIIVLGERVSALEHRLLNLLSSLEA